MGPRSGVTGVSPVGSIGHHDRVDDDDLLEPDEGAPICPACGVTALPGEGDGFVCENPDCDAFGERVPAR